MVAVKPLSYLLGRGAAAPAGQRVVDADARRHAFRLLPTDHRDHVFDRDTLYTEREERGERAEEEEEEEVRGKTKTKTKRERQTPNGQEEVRTRTPKPPPPRPPRRRRRPWLRVRTLRSGAGRGAICTFIFSATESMGNLYLALSAAVTGSLRYRSPPVCRSAPNIGRVIIHFSGKGQRTEKGRGREERRLGVVLVGLIDKFMLRGNILHFFFNVINVPKGFKPEVVGPHMLLHLSLPHLFLPADPADPLAVVPPSLPPVEEGTVVPDVRPDGGLGEEGGGAGGTSEFLEQEHQRGELGRHTRRQT